MARVAGDRRVRVLLALVLSTAAACSGRDAPLESSRQAVDVDSSKVDAAVLSAMPASDSLSVIVLGRSQLLEPIGGLDQHQRSHDQSPRQAIRAEVVARLRTL